MSSSPWRILRNGDEDVATPFQRGGRARYGEEPRGPRSAALAARVGIAIGIANLYQLDPLCLAPLKPDATLDPGNPPPSNRRMAERLATFRNDHDPSSLFFRSDVYVPILAKAWDEASDPIERLQTGIQLGLHQAQAGRPDSALNTYAAMEAIIANGIDVPPSRRSQLRMRQAVAFLRMGEQENCIARHGPESCLFPLSPPPSTSSRAVPAVPSPSLRNN